MGFITRVSKYLPVKIYRTSANFNSKAGGLVLFEPCTYWQEYIKIFTPVEY